MSKIERFEDVVAWQRARELTREIYGSSRVGAFARAEGSERGGDKEFIQFVSNSKGSCGEVKSHPYVALDQQYVTDNRFKALYQQADEVSRLVAGFMGYLQQSTVRGHKFKRLT